LQSPLYDPLLAALQACGRPGGMLWPDRLARCRLFDRKRRRIAGGLRSGFNAQRSKRVRTHHMAGHGHPRNRLRTCPCGILEQAYRALVEARNEAPLPSSALTAAPPEDPAAPVTPCTGARPRFPHRGPTPRCPLISPISTPGAAGPLTVGQLSP
jgi:hypothetical protein